MLPVWSLRLTAIFALLWKLWILAGEHSHWKPPLVLFCKLEFSTRIWMSLDNNLLGQFCSVQTERSESFLNSCISGQIKKLNCWAKIHRTKQEWRERGYHFAFLVPFAVFPHHQLHLAPDYYVQAKGTECFPVYHRQDDNRNRYMKMAIQEQEQSGYNSSHKKTRKYQRINPNPRNP